MDEPAVAAAIELDLALDLAAGGEVSLADWLARHPAHHDLVRAAWQRREAVKNVRPVTAEATVAAFEAAYAADRARGAVRSLTEYLADHAAAAFTVAERFAVRDADRVVTEVATEFDVSVGTLLGRYRIGERIGRGGQGSVHRAEDTALGRVVAIKVMPAFGERAAAALARLAAEARAGAKISHPAFCTVHDAGVVGDVAFLVMAFVEGQPLLRSLEHARLAAVDPQARHEGDALALHDDAARGHGRLCTFVAKTARALHALHEAGLVHRDLKPANVMVTPDGEPVVLDFGLARDDDAAALTRTGDVVGTPAYMAPEQIELAPAQLDCRVDVHALGVMLYEGLTLRHPFAAATRAGTFAAILGEGALDVRHLQPAVSADLAVVVAKAMERDRDRRYPTALALAEDLEAVVRGAPIRARAPGPLRRLGRWRRRHPALATAAAFVGLAGAAFVWQQTSALERVRAARDEALAVNDFLVEKLLLSVTPEEAQGRVVRASDTLDRAAAAVATGFPQATPVAAAIRHVLGRANARLARWNEALTWYEQALQMRREAIGPTHPDTFATVVGLAVALQELTRLPEAQALLDSSLESAATTLGEKHPAALSLSHQRGLLALARGSREEAVSRLAAVFAARQEVLGPDATDTFDSGVQLSRARVASGELQAGITLLRGLVGRRTSVSGEDDPAVVNARNALASMLHDDRQWDEAMALYDGVLTYTERVFGRDSARYAVALNNCASLLQARGRDGKDAAMLDRAEAMFRESLAARERVYGKDSEQVAKACNNLGLLMNDRGAYARGAELFERAIGIRTALLGSDHIDTVRTRFALAVARWKEESEGAVDGMFTVVAAAQGVMGEADAEFAGMLALSGFAACGAGRTEEGIARLERAYGLLSQAVGAAATNTRWAATQLRVAYEARGDADAAAVWDRRSRGER